MKEVKIIIYRKERRKIVGGGYYSSNGYRYNYEDRVEYEVYTDIDKINLQYEDIKAIQNIFPEDKYDSGCDWGIDNYEFTSTDISITESVCKQLNVCLGEKYGFHFIQGSQKKCRYQLKNIIVSDIIKITNGKLEAFTDDLVKMKLESVQGKGTKYHIKGYVNELNGNTHYNVSIREIGTGEYVGIKGWKLKEISFQKSRDELETPTILVVDPIGNEFCPRIPYVLQKEIYDVPNSRVYYKHEIGRIIDGVKIFVEVASYLNMKHYMLINEYTSIPDINLAKYGQRFVEVFRNKSSYTQEQLLGFYELYAIELSHYFNIFYKT